MHALVLHYIFVLNLSRQLSLTLRLSLKHQNQYGAMRNPRNVYILPPAAEDQAGQESDAEDADNSKSASSLLVK